MKGQNTVQIGGNVSNFITLQQLMKNVHVRVHILSKRFFYFKNKIKRLHVILFSLRILLRKNNLKTQY